MKNLILPTLAIIFVITISILDAVINSKNITFTIIQVSLAILVPIVTFLIMIHKDKGI
jgi:hypothetical protein